MPVVNAFATVETASSSRTDRSEKSTSGRGKSGIFLLSAEACERICRLASNSRRNFMIGVS